MIILVQFGINKHLLIKRPQLHEPVGREQFC